MRLGGPWTHTGQVRKNTLPPGFDTMTIQPVVSRYIERTTVQICSLKLHEAIHGLIHLVYELSTDFI